MSLVGIALLTCASALAEESEFAGATDTEEAVDEPVTELSVEIGGMLAGGNTETVAVNGALRSSHHWKKNKVALMLLGNFGQSIVDANGDGFLDESERAVGFTPTAKRYEGELRYDRFLNEKNSVYALVGGFTDEVAGDDLRTHEQVGFAHFFINDETRELRAELGADVAQENYTQTAVDAGSPENATIIAARLLLGVALQLNENVSLSETVEVYENVQQTDDVRVLNAIGFTTTVTEVFSVKLSHNLTYDNVPVQGYQPLDHTGMLTLVASLM